MARFRVWLRIHVRGLCRISKNKSQQQDQRKNEAREGHASLQDLNISKPILLNEDMVHFKPLPPLPFPNAVLMQSIQEPKPETLKFNPTDIIGNHYKDGIMEDTHSISPPSTLVEDIEAAPSLCEDSDDDTMPEHLWPTTPTSPTHFSSRINFLRIINANDDGHYDPIISRPQSFASTTPSQTRQAHRPSDSTVLSDQHSMRTTINKRAIFISQSSLNRDKRINIQSFNDKRRATVISVSKASNRLGGIEWDESRANQRFRRRMSWGFETFSTLTSAYVPVRI
jgi:hypothetical protein